MIFGGFPGAWAGHAMVRDPEMTLYLPYTHAVIPLYPSYTLLYLIPYYTLIPGPFGYTARPWSWLALVISKRPRI